ncbi:MAG: ABC transporter ATP-binding protein [Actinobacteria bacterium RBG_16_64_13]|nr:MAG: ABC transporter ATP-binding protein [Actinobacteria bacterium RBG_16_64_13]
MSITTPVLAASDLSKHYGNAAVRVAAVEGVSLTVERGEFVAIMGPSGSGKSTLLSILGAMNPPTGGRVLIDEIDVYQLRQDRQADLRREYLGFVFQQLELIPYLTALENVMLPLAILKEDGKRDRALAALERVGLDEAKANRLPSALSGGEQGRVAIARAVVNDPPIILADEPTGSLDTATGDQVLSLLRQLAGHGHAVIMVTHNPESLRTVDRVVMLRDGRLASDSRVTAGTDQLLAPHGFCSG